ncbi:MAG: hypothetical protein OXH41_13190 [Chloroflexi bacterium]|nr:hypothetical protein [Chloroflexota bacterium]
MPAHDAGPRPHLTEEQDEQRLRGLRALARLIVRHHLAVTAGRRASRNGARPQTPGEEDPHAD